MIRVLIEHDPGLRVFYTSTAPAGFDTHAAQLLHASRAAADRFPRAVAGFLAELRDARPGRAGRGPDVLGIRPASAGERPGRDRPRRRGPGFPRGAPGSRRVGRPAPDLANLDNGDLKFAVDFRDIYATLLRRWLHVDPVPVLGRRDEACRSFEMASMYVHGALIISFMRFPGFS